MTYIATSPSSAPLPVVATVTDRLLAAIGGASFGTADDLYARDVVLDATVPGWRYKVSGDDQVRAEYGRWFTAVGDLTEVRRLSTPDGCVVEYFLTWTEDGRLHGAHHAHLLTIDAATDRICADHVFCGGRWPAEQLAEMNAPLFVTSG